MRTTEPPVQRKLQIAPRSERAAPSPSGGAASFAALEAAERLGPRFGAIAVRAGVDAPPPKIREAARLGTRGAGGPLPHLPALQRAFGRHDLSRVRAHTDHAAARGARAMGASAFAVGETVAFDGAPDLHTAAHEAAHVVQQRAGVEVPSGVGRAGDGWERHADRVADAAAAGRDAAPLLDALANSAGSGPATPSVQRQIVDTNLEPVGIEIDDLDADGARTVLENVENRIWILTDDGDLARIQAIAEGGASSSSDADLGRGKRERKPAKQFDTAKVYAQKRGNMSSSQQKGMEQFVQSGPIGMEYTGGGGSGSDDEAVDYSAKGRQSLYKKGKSPLDHIADKSKLSGGSQDTTAVAVSRDQRTLYVAHQGGKAFRKAVELATKLKPDEMMPDYNIVACDEFTLGGLHAEMQIIYYCLVKGIALGSLHAMGVAGGKGTCEMCSFVLAKLGIGFSFIEASHFHHLWQDPFQLAGKKPPFDYPKQ